MEKMVGPSYVFSSEFSEYGYVLERLESQQSGGLNYDKKSGKAGEVCFPTSRSEPQKEALRSPQPTILGCVTIYT
jgi:hypothetical protein